MSAGDEPTDLDVVVAAAALLVAAVPAQSFRRRNLSDRVPVNRTQLVRLAEAIEEAAPGLLDRIRPRAVADVGRNEAAAARRRAGD